MVITNTGLTLKAKAANHFMAQNDKITTIYSESSSWMKSEDDSENMYKAGRTTGTKI